MKVTTERIPESQVVLEIEVDGDRVEKAKETAYRRLAAKAKVPGFRPGKVPRSVLERHLGEHTILHEAIDRLMPEVYREALEQEAIDPIDRAEYELVTEEPLVAKFTVPVRPSVDLGEYISLDVPREAVEVDPERVQEGIEALRHRYATLEPVERPVAWGDIVRADVGGTIEGSAFVKEEDAQFQLVEGRAVSLPGFADGLLGHTKGEEFDVEVPVPDDFPDEKMRGKQAVYHVSLKEVKQEVLPELSDDFAREVGEGFENVEALRARIESDLREAEEQEAEHRQHDAALDSLVDIASLEYPPVLVEREIDRIIQEQSGALQPASGKQRDGREALERYLQQVGKSEEALREEIRPIAKTRVERSLVLSELSEAEHIAVADSDVEAEIERLSAGAGTQGDELRRLFSTESAKESLRRSLLTRKTLERLVEIASKDGAVVATAQAEASESG